MKELSFEIKIPTFLTGKSGQEKLRLFVSAVWLILTVYLKLKFDLAFLETLILAYFGLALVWTLKSRISATLALFFLVCEPFLLYMKNDTLAETFAVYAYYFLVITVIQEILALRKAEEKPVRQVIHRTPRQVKRRVV